MPATRYWNIPQFKKLDQETVDLGKLLIMNGKRLSSKASNSTTFLTACMLKSSNTQIAFDKRNLLCAIPEQRAS